MSECTVHSPCGRYVVHFASDTARQVLQLKVTAKGQQTADGARATSFTGGPPDAAPTTSCSSSSACAAPLRLTACLGEVDVATLTASAGVRKSFGNFAEMLYGALIGRSAAVHFYVETVAEMKERIQRDVQRNEPPPSSAQPRRPSAAAATAAAAVMAEDEASARSLLLTTSTAAMMTGAAAGPGRLRTAVGDTVIELDEDIAADVLAQRFLTLDYDVDFTRAIFPIPLRVAEASEVLATRSITTTCSSSTPRAASAVAHADAPSESSTEATKAELADLRAALARAEAENAKLRREKDALVQVSRHKMEEMQRLCADFETQVRLAAEAERLRARNAALRVELQEALEGQQAALRTLERERSQRRLLPHPTAAAAAAADRSASRGDVHSAGAGVGPGRGAGSRAGSRQSSTGSTAGARRSSSGPRGEGNPYLRSLSRDSYGRQRSAGSTATTHTNAAAAGSDYQHSLQPCHGQQQQRRRRPLMSPTPPHAATRGGRTLRSPSPVRAAGRRSTRFDTPPPPQQHSSARACEGTETGLTHSWRDRDGDSPAPYGHTGGRLDAALKPRRGGSISSNSGGGGSGSGGATATARTPGGSRASSAHSVPQRGASLWAGCSSDRASACGSAVSSSRGSSTSANHERLYHASTASTRLRESPKAHLLHYAAPSRRAVFH